MNILAASEITSNKRNRSTPLEAFTTKKPRFYGVFRSKHLTRHASLISGSAPRFQILQNAGSAAVLLRRFSFPRYLNMSTEAQRTANQANAKHSTGPKSPEGKAISSRNNVRV